MKNLGIIGTGNVACEILKYKFNNIKKIFVYDIDLEKAHLFTEEFFYKNIQVLGSLKELVRFSDIIVEAASISAVDEIFNFIKTKNFKNKQFIILSVGGILKNFKLYKKLISTGYKIYIPSGAIVGLDGLVAAKIAGIKSIYLKTIKPTSSLLSSLYFKKNKTLNEKVLKTKRITVFEGDVYKAVKYFPQNINVAATLAVLCGDPKKVKVKIIADKKLTRNIHEVKIESYCGKIFTRTENIPSPNNPKTSYLAALSVIALLKDLLKS